MPRPRSDIAPRILVAARKRFLAEGVDGASLRTIARDAGTSIGMVYYYFPTKDELFLAVVSSVYTGLLADFRRELGAAGDFEARLRRLFARYGALSPDELEVLRLVARELLAGGSRFAPLVERFRLEHLALITELLQLGLAEGALDARRHPALLMVALLGVGALPQAVRCASEGFAPFEGLGTGPELSSELVDILLHGLAPRGAHQDSNAPPRMSQGAP
jgi:AcrR family transcriptional regulator